MASGSTSIWGRPYPLSSDTPAVHSDIQALANSLETTPLYPTTAVTSRTGVAGESVVVTPGQTLTLPSSPATGDMIRIIAGSSASGISPVTVAAAGGKVISGNALISVSSFLLGTPYARAVLQYDGTKWLMIEGQADTGWVAITLGGGVSAGAGYVPAARQVGDKVELCGELVGSGTTAWGTVPFHPGVTVFLETQGALQISSAGAITTNGTSSVYLDGKSFRGG